MPTSPPHESQIDANLARFVIPVRYVSDGAVVQTTSTCLTKDVIHVRSVRPPRAGLVLGLQLYFPNVREAVRSIALVTETTTGESSGFWAELSESKHGDDGIAALLARQRDTGERGCSRFHAHLRATIRDSDQRSANGTITNLSRSGAFVRIDSLPRLGSIVDLDFPIPGARARQTAVAFVVHVAERRGIGVQFIGGSDDFRSRVDEYVARLAG